MHEHGLERVADAEPKELHVRRRLSVGEDDEKPVLDRVGEEVRGDHGNECLEIRGAVRWDVPATAAAR